MSQNRPNARNASSVAPRIALPAQDEDVATLRRSIVAKLTYSVGRDPIVASERDWFIATALAVRDRVVERWVPATRAAYLQGRKRVYYLSLEFLHRPAAVRLPQQSQPGGTGAHRLGRARRRFRPPARAGARRCPGQWRPGPAGRLLHGQPRSSRHPRPRLRHPLRPWPVSPGDPRRLAAGVPGELVVLRQPLGIRSSRSQPHGRLRRFGRNDRHRRHQRCDLAPGGKRRRGRLRHAGDRLARAIREHAAPVVGARGRPADARRVQPRRPCRRAGRRFARQCHITDPVSQRRDPRGPGTAAAAGVFLLLRVVAEPGVPPHAAARQHPHAGAGPAPSSSTTPIPPSPCPR